jgi:hypothetical protein
MTPDEMIEALMLNVIMYGTGLVKLSYNKQGELEMSIVPIEDYMYINTKEKTNVTYN